MVYEYETENIRKLNNYNVISGSSNITKPIEELHEVYRKAKTFDLIRNSYTTEIEQAIKNKELNQCLFLLEQILDDLERGSDE